MADNVQVTQGTGTSIATDEISGVQHQKVKIEFGNDGSATMVSSDNPLPVSATIDTAGLATSAKQDDIITAIDNISVSVDTTGLATDTKQDAGNASLTSIDGKTPSLGQALAAASVPVVLPAAQISTLTPQTNALTDTQLRASDVKITLDGETVPVTGTFWQATQPVSASSLPLPTGAATAAKQPALGTAGTPSSDVISVQGITSMTPLKTDGSGVTQPVSGTVTANAGTNLNTSALALESGGNLAAIKAKTDNIPAQGQALAAGSLPVVLPAAQITTLTPPSSVGITSIAAGDNNIGNVDLASALPAGSAVIGKVGIDQTTPGTTNLVALSAETTKVIGTVRVASGGIASGAIASGAVASGAVASGAFASGSIASGALASGSIATGAIVDALADDSSFTVATSRVFPNGLMADETATDSVDEGDVGVPRMTLDRKTIVTTYPHTAGGCDLFRSIDLDETEEDVKTSAGNLYGYYFANTTASARYLKLYNATAANTTVGTTTPIATFYLPPTSAGHVGLPYPISFATALCAAATTGVADNNTGAPGASDVLFMAWYK